MVQYRQAAAVLGIAVLLAGCTTLSGGEEGEEETETLPTTPADGLTIRFSAKSATIPENEVIQFDIGVDNTGGKTAAIQRVFVFGAPFIDNGGRCQPLNRLSTGTELLAGSPGPHFTWRCQPPLAGSDGAFIDLPHGATNTFDAGLGLVYRYRTTARTSIRVVTPRRIDTQSPVVTENTAGPVHARVQVQSPRSATNSGKLRVPVTIRNVGGGEVVDGAVEIEEIRVDDSTVSVSTAGAQNPVQLVDGSRQVVLELPGFGMGEDGLEKTVDIAIDLRYDYRERTSTTFTVQGQPDDVKIESMTG